MAYESLGKSTLCSKIIEHLQDKVDSTVIFYFCRHDNVTRSPALDILRTLATQLLAANNDFAPYIIENYINAGKRPSRKILLDIIGTMIGSIESVRVILDGVDEWPEVDLIEAIEDLLSLNGPQQGQCKVLVSSRRVRSLSKTLGSKSILRLEDHAEHLNSTISSFVNVRLHSLRKKFDTGLVDELQRTILSKANLMFLWVKLVMSTLEDLYYESDLRDAIDNIPEDMEGLYAC